MTHGLMRMASIISFQYKPHKYNSSDIESLAIEHKLERESYVANINKVTCKDITYIH